MDGVEGLEGLEVRDRVSWMRAMMRGDIIPWHISSNSWFRRLLRMIDTRQKKKKPGRGAMSSIKSNGSVKEVYVTCDA